MEINKLVLYTVLGLLTITLIDTIGSIVSRRLNFKFVYLAPLSLITFATVGYFVSKDYNLSTAITCTSLLGFYDATAGWQFSLFLKANSGLSEEQIKQSSTVSRVVGMIIIAVVLGYLGYIIAGSLNN